MACGLGLFIIYKAQAARHIPVWRPDSLVWAQYMEINSPECHHSSSTDDNHSLISPITKKVLRISGSSQQSAERKYHRVIVCDLNGLEPSHRPPHRFNNVIILSQEPSTRSPVNPSASQTASQTAMDDTHATTSRPLARTSSENSTSTAQQTTAPPGETSAKRRRVTRTMDRGNIDCRLSDDVLTLVDGVWFIPKACNRWACSTRFAYMYLS